MATTRSKSEAQMLENYRVALTNVEIQPEIVQTMAQFGYDSAKIAEGKALLDATYQAYNFNKQEDQETIVTRIALHALLEDLLEIYVLQRKKAKIIFRNEEATISKLGLKGSFPQTFVKQVEEMKTFYKRILSDKKIQDQLLRLQILPEDITAGQTAVNNIEKARAAYLNEIGESQDATKQKNAAFDSIDDWMQEFYAISKIAMEDSPQLLEALGIFVRS